MAEKVVLAEAYGGVLVDDTVPCVIVQFYSFANRDQFKRIMAVGLEYYQAHNQPTRPWGWVGDTRKMGAIPKEVQQWLAEHWNGQAYAAGLREVSIVVSENVFGQLATQQYVQQTTERLITGAPEPRYYHSLAEAKQGAAKRCAALKAH